MTIGHERVLVGKVGAELLAFALDTVREVIDAPAVQDVPLAAAVVRGHLRLRDAHLPVLDAGILLGVRSELRTAGVALVFADGYALQLDDAHDVWERDAATVLPVPAGADRLGVLRALLRRGDEVASFVDTTVLRARAVATLRELPGL